MSHLCMRRSCRGVWLKPTYIYKEILFTLNQKIHPNTSSSSGVIKNLFKGSAPSTLEVKN